MGEEPGSDTADGRQILYGIVQILAQGNFHAMPSEECHDLRIARRARRGRAPPEPRQTSPGPSCSCAQQKTRSRHIPIALCSRFLPFRNDGGPPGQQILYMPPDKRLRPDSNRRQEYGKRAVCKRVRHLHLKDIRRSASRAPYAWNDAELHLRSLGTKLVTDPVQSLTSRRYDWLRLTARYSAAHERP
jgi:hypothetical protein